jgi:hypothetical protein
MDARRWTRKGPGRTRPRSDVADDELQAPRRWTPGLIAMGPRLVSDHAGHPNVPSPAPNVGNRRLETIGSGSLTGGVLVRSLRMWSATRTKPGDRSHGFTDDHDRSATCSLGCRAWTRWVPGSSSRCPHGKRGCSGILRSDATTQPCMPGDPNGRSPSSDRSGGRPCSLRCPALTRSSRDPILSKPAIQSWMGRHGPLQIAKTSRTRSRVAFAAAATLTPSTRRARLARAW